MGREQSYWSLLKWMRSVVESLSQKLDLILGLTSMEEYHLCR